MNAFFNAVKKFFAPPVFADDEEKTRAAELANTILVSLTGVLVLAIIGLVVGSRTIPTLIALIVTLVLLLTLQIPLRRGSVRPTALSIVILLTILVAFSLRTIGTVRAPTVVGFVLASIIAGLTISRRAAFWSTGINILIFSGLAIAEISNRLPQTVQQTNIQQPILFAALSLMTVVLLSQALRRIQTALDIAKQSQDELTRLNVGLEQRVADRTQALSTVAEISSTASTVLDTDKLLQQVVDLAKERFNFYHAHIYLLNETGDTLVLSSGAGEVGRQMVAEGHSIPLDREQSLVARAAREKKGVTVNDVTMSPDFLSNPLLPNTHSEMAVPMMVGEQVLGVFDVQSEVVGRFTEADIAVQTTLASQVAAAIQNSRSFTEIQRSRAQLAEALSISRLGNWEYDVYNDIFTFNDQFYSIFRTTAEKVGGYKISSADYAKNFVHPEDAALVGSEIQKALETKERYYRAALEHRIIFEDGETGYISVNVNVERNENGKIIRWYGANQDITERRRLEELNRKRAGQQEAINLITQKIQSAITVEEALQVAAREIGRALGHKSTVVALDPAIPGSVDRSFVE